MEHVKNWLDRFVVWLVSKLPVADKAEIAEIDMLITASLMEHYDLTFEEAVGVVEDNKIPDKWRDEWTKSKS